MSSTATSSDPSKTPLIPQFNDPNQVGKFLGSNQMVEMMMGTLMMGTMAHMNETEMSFQKIMLLILIVCMGELKGVFSDLVSTFKVFCKSLPSLLVSMYKKYQEVISITGAICIVKNYIHPKEVEILPPVEIKPLETSVSINMTLTLPVLNSVHKFLQISAKNSFTNSFKFNATSLVENTSTIEYENSSFDIDEDTHVLIPNKISVVINNKDGSLSGFSVVESVFDFTSSIFYSKLKISDWKRQLDSYMKMKETVVHYNKILADGKFCSIKNMQIIFDCIKNKNYESESEAVNKTFEDAKRARWIDYMMILLLDNYATEHNSLDFVNSSLYNDFLIVCLLANIVEVAGYSTIGFEWRNSGTLQMIVSNSIMYELNIKMMSNKMCSWGDSGSFKINYRPLDTISPQTSKSVQYKEDTINFIVTTPGKIDNKILFDKFNIFYNTQMVQEPVKVIDLRPSYKRNNTVYLIGIEITEKPTTVPNPDYEDWKVMFDAKNEVVEPNSTEGGKKKKKFNNNNFGFVDIFTMKPEKTITTIEKITNIVAKKVCEFNKGMDTLYLREADKRKLVNVVDKFKNKKELYQRLGIPYKLGMMLAGKPGVGKTSTVKAIASYLDKNAYFVNLKGVKKNSEAKAIFDHISDNCGGGIIMFEDIDAMTDIVKKRTHDAKELSLHEVVENDDTLSLSFLLNLLDGTLCKDGTIFIMTTNHLEHIDPALYRKGRVDLIIDFSLCDHFQIKTIFKTFMERDISQAVLDKIPIDTYPPCDIISHVYTYMTDTDIKDEEIMSEFIPKEDLFKKGISYEGITKCLQIVDPKYINRSTACNDSDEDQIYMN